MQPPAQSPELVPFGSYLLDELIAVGGMARVYRARLRGLGGFEKTLVVKQVLPELATDPRFVAMFVEEAKTLVQLSHPHIVPVYELGVIDGVYFLSMEHVEGATLAEVLAEGPLPPELACHVGIQLAEALHYAHGRFDLVHRDVTPRNVLVDGEGHVRLLDFGIAAPAHDAGVAGVFGSPGYMSPEQARGEPVSAPSDLFSLGCVLFEALTGRPAFLRADPSATRAALLEGPPPRLAGSPAVPAEIAAVVDRCLLPEARLRPTSASEVARALRAWLASEHPEGVGSALGARATEARVRGRRPGAERTPTPSRTSQPGAGSRKLATSPILTALLEGEGAPTEAPRGSEGPLTVPITGRLPPAPEPPEPPPPARGLRRAGRTLVGSLVVGAALAAGALALREGTPHEGAPRALGSDPPATPPQAPRPEDDAPPGATPGADAAPHGARAVEPPARPASDGAAPPSTETPSRAALVINATPWAAVTVDGRPVGDTPLRHVPVAAGTHRVRFECPPLGRTAEITVQTEPGGTRRILAHLDTDPPSAAAR